MDSATLKAQLFNKVLERLEKKLETLVASALEAKEASTNEESKAENKYDTRGLEASYLASGQAQRVKELQETIFLIKKIEIKDFTAGQEINVSALVQVSDEEEQTRWFFILPSSGLTISTDDMKVQTVSLNSPMGHILYGKVCGDEFVLNNKEYLIQDVL